MVSLDLNKVKQGQQTSSTNVNNTTTSSNQPINTGIGQTGINEQIENTLTILEITYVEYLKYCQNNQEFSTYNISKQKEIVDADRANQTNNTTPAPTQTQSASTAVETETTKPTSTTLAPDSTTATKATSPVEQTNTVQTTPAETTTEPEESVQNEFLDDFERTSNYDFAAFDKLQGKEKLQIIFTELARNNYLYGEKNSKRTPEDWENLSDKEKSALIQQAEEQFIAENEKHFHLRLKQIKNSENSTKEDIKKFLSHNALHHLENVLLANWLGVSASEYNSRHRDLKSDDFNEAFAFDYTQNENLTESQKNRIKSNLDLTKAFGYFLATEGNKPDNQYWQQDIINPASKECLRGELNAYNKKHGTNITFSDIREMYMKYQLENNLVPENELEAFTQRYNRIVKYNKSSLKTIVNSKNMDELIKEGKVKLVEPSTLSELSTYGYTSDLAENEKLKIIAEYLDNKLKNVTDTHEQADIITSLIYELLAESPDNGELASIIHFNAVKTGGKALQIELAKRYDLISQANNSLNTAAYTGNDEAILSIQQGQIQLAQSTNAEFRAYADLFAMETMNNATDEQNVLLSKDYSSWDSDDVQKHHADVAMNMLTRSKEQANEMLSNMSQYSSEETLKYAADQIQNLDKSVQQEALNHIYESGNQAAIDTAIKNLTNAPQVIQEAELPRVFTEATLNSVDLSDPKIAKLDLTKRLTTEQLASLSPSQKHAYYANLFVQASANDKIKILEKMPNGNQKKTIFTIIARFVPRLLENMVESGMGLQMLSSNLPMDASNKVLKTMLKSENPDVKKQVAEIRKDKNYAERLENMETSIDEQHNTKNINRNNTTTNYMSTPADLAKTLGLTPKDVANIKTMYARYIQGGFKA